MRKTLVHCFATALIALASARPALAFARNVGRGDRLLRLISGAALTGVGWYLGATPWIAVTLSVFGLMWTSTGVLAQCSIYYALEYATCPVSGEPSALRRPGVGNGPNRGR
jgi:apolipoprotein N-acyltransferase